MLGPIQVLVRVVVCVVIVGSGTRGFAERGVEAIEHDYQEHESEEFIHCDSVGIRRDMASERDADRVAKHRERMSLP